MIHDLLPFVVSGIVAGSLYGLAATGLVLTYKTSGVFNFSHGAIGAGAAYLFYDLRDLVGLPAWLAVLLTVGVAAPCLGLILSLLAARLATVSTAQRVVATVGVLLLIQGVVQLRYGIAPISFATSLPTSTFRIAGINVGYDQLITALLAVAGVVALSVLFRTSRLGLQMRAVADNAELLGLARQAPPAVRAKAWMIGSAFAAGSGILLAPAIGLDALVLTLVVVQAFGAAAVGRFQSTTLAFVGGVGIGIVQNLLNAPRVREVVPFANDLPGLDQAVPFIVLFAVLLATRGDRLHERAVPRAPRSRIAYPRPLVASLLLIGAGSAVALPFLFESRVPVYTLGAVFVIVFASLFLLTEVSNQVSLCQVSFVALGATTFCHVTTGLGLPWAVGLIAAGLVGVPLGAIVAIPAIRLSGLFLALATLGFGVLVEKLLYPRAFMFGAFGSRIGARPGVLGLSHARPYYFLCVALAAGALTVVVAVRRSRLGRLLHGLADSPVALATHGSSINVTRVLVFCISAFLAGTAGALYVGVVGSVSSSGASPTALVSFNSLVWLAVLAFVGRSAILTPMLAAGVLVIGPSYLTNPNTSQHLTIAFGLIAVVACAFTDDALRRITAALPRAQDRVRRSPAAERGRLWPLGVSDG
jgi:branched-subunit amino acid ABC-type transport system permease component